MVPPGTAARAAALTLSAVSPVNSSSLRPFVPTWPPLAGSKLAGCWSDGVAGAWLAVVGALVVVDWAVAEPLIRAAPVRPTPMRVLRRGCNLVSYRYCP